MSEPSTSLTKVSSIAQRGASYALNHLNDLISSAHKRGSTETKFVVALKKLKDLAFDDKCRGKEFNEEDLRKVGINENDFPGFDTIVTLHKSQKGHNVGSFTSGLFLNIFLDMKATELEDDEFTHLVYDYCSLCPWAQSRYPVTSDQFHLLCEILCNVGLRRTVQKFVNADGGALEKKREILIDHLKMSFASFATNLTNNDYLLHIIHEISYCGEDVKRIVPEEIPKLDLNRTRLSVLDVASLCSVINHSSLLHCLSMQGCDLTSNVLQTLADGLRNSGLKISELDVSWNWDMGVDGLGYIGRIVKDNNVDKLKMANCELKHEELESFSEHMIGVKIKQLHLSPHGLFPYKYVFPLDAVCSLLPNVTERLTLTGNEPRIKEISLLQEKLHRLHPTELKINFKHPGPYPLPDLTSDLSSEEYWKLHDTANYLGFTEGGDLLQKEITDPSRSDTEEAAASPVHHGEGVVEFPSVAEKVSHSGLKAPRKERENHIDNLKKSFVGSHGNNLFRVIRTIFLYGGDAKRIVPDEISKVNLNYAKLSASDVAIVCSVICHSSLLHCLSMQNCMLTSEVLQALANGLQDFKLKISKLDVSRNTSMGEDGFSSIGSIVKNNNVDKVKMRHCGLKHEDLESFSKHTDGVKFSELDVSWNQNMGADGLSCIGRLLKNNNIGKLKMAGCELKHKQLESFSKHSNSAKLSELDVSCNKNMGTNELISIGRIVKNNSIDKLKMTSCDLKHEELKSFNKHSNGAKLCELSVSWNWRMGANGLSSIGRIVKNNNIKDLNMQGCGLKYEELESFSKCLDGAKISKIDVSGNKTMGTNGLSSIGRIVKNNHVDELKMTGCDLKPEELESFSKHLNGAKIKHLDLSSQVHATYNFPLDAVCHLLPNVTKCLNLTGNKLRFGEISLLQDRLHCLHPAEMKVQIKQAKSPGKDARHSVSTFTLPDLTSDLTSEEYWRLPDAANYLHQIEEEELLRSESENAGTSLLLMGKSDLDLLPAQKNIPHSAVLTAQKTVGAISALPEETMSKPSQIIIDTSYPAILKTTPYLHEMQEKKVDRVPLGEAKSRSSSAARKCPAEDDLLSKTSTNMIEKSGGKIEAGECIVDFPPNCLDVDRLVTITAEIGSKKRPHIEGQIITPSLVVKIGARRLNKAATVRLATWCFIEDNTEAIPVHVLHFSKRINKWEIIHKCRLNNSGFIEFQCLSFCRFVALIPSWVYSLFCYKLQSSVYASNRNFAITLQLKNKLCKEALRQTFREMKGDFQLVTFGDVFCLTGGSVDSMISCISPPTFKFQPSGNFPCDLKTFSAGYYQFIEQCMLESESIPPSSNAEGRFSIAFKVMKADKTFFNHQFFYDCDSDNESSPRSTLMQSLSCSQAEKPNESISIAIPQNISGSKFAETFDNLKLEDVQQSVIEVFQQPPPAAVKESSVDPQSQADDSSSSENHANRTCTIVGDVHFHIAPTVAGSINYGNQRGNPSNNTTTVTGTFSQSSRK